MAYLIPNTSYIIFFLLLTHTINILLKYSFNDGMS